MVQVRVMLWFTGLNWPTSAMLPKLTFCAVPIRQSLVITAVMVTVLSLLTPSHQMHKPSAPRPQMW
ncbi:hypothetical protein D3C80_2078610 [compost metagenome]